MHSLNIDGKKSINYKEILQHEVKFYQILYTSENTYVENINSYLSETTYDKILSHDEASFCDGILTEQEATKAVLNMKQNKFPLNFIKISGEK